MFKSSRWRIDKLNHTNTHKIKSIFTLHFRLTQVPVVVGDALLLSVIPKDVGKPTSKLDKAMVKDGVCSWENPVIETVRFVRDPKSGKINERVYYFIISTGSLKSSVVGEVLIDFAEYAESIKPASVSLPFKNPQCSAILHVTIQRMLENGEQREALECEDVKIKLEDKTQKIALSKDEFEEKVDRPLVRTTSDYVELNRDSGSDLLTSSECSSELDTPREVVRKMRHGPSSLKSSLSSESLNHKEIAKTLSSPHHGQQLVVWSVGFDGLGTEDSTISSQDGSLQKQRSLSAADVDIEKRKTDLVVLARQAEFSELELQTLRKQIVKEGKRGNELSREVIGLKEERDALKEECENMKAAQKRADDVKVKNRGIRDPLILIEELRQELQYEKDLNANLKVQLEKTQDSNSELILAVQDLDKMLELNNTDTPSHPYESPRCETVDGTPRSTFKCHPKDEEQKALEDLVKRHNDVQDASLLEEKVIELYHEMETCRRERDEVENQMEQLALDYEILKQENHEMAYRLEQSQLQEQLKMQYECSYTSVNELEGQIEGLENELRKQKEQYADSLTKISELQTQVQSLEDELEEQAQGFEADLEAVTRAKVEQEQRAIRAEEALRATKRKNASTAERLQEEFTKLSLQMASTFDANEKLAMKSLNEAAELRLEKNRIEILLHKAKEELLGVRREYEAKLDDLASQIKLSTNHTNELGAEVEEKTKKLEVQNLREKEMQRDLSQEMLMLKAEIQRLTEENDTISKEGVKLQAQLQQANKSTDETELLLIGRDVELSELEETIALVTEKAEKSMEELAAARSIIKEKETALDNLVSGLENLRAQYCSLKQKMAESELERELLRKQVLELKTDMNCKEEALSTSDKQLQELHNARKEATHLKETVKVLEDQIALKEIALETSTKTFLGAEMILLDKIKALESRAEELIHQVDRSTTRDALGTSNIDEVEQTGGELSKTSAKCNQEGLEMSVLTSDEINQSATLSDMEKLKEQNLLMESELKELQGRYSEISLKFAEVEGERQKLIMSLRYLKNARKS